MENINVKYYLVLEKRPYDYLPINIDLLDIGSGINYTDIVSIDLFTKAFTKEEIFNSIKNSNTVTDDYMKGNLMVIAIPEKSKKYSHSYPALTSDVLNGFDFPTYIIMNIKDKNIMNAILMKFSNIVKNEEMKDQLKMAIQSENVKEILKILLQMPYIQNRELCLYIMEKLNNKENSYELLRKKAA